jgi:hypothetical protein
MAEMTTDPDTHQEILDLVRRLSDAISDGDPARVVAEFATTDAVVMFGSEQEEIAYGLQALTALWQRVLSRGHRYAWEWSDQRIARMGDVAWLSATATVALEQEAGSSKREIPYRLTLVVVREGARWAIAQYHGAEPAAAW